MVTRQRVPDMNRNHRELCASDGWGEYIRDDLLPWVTGDRFLGGSVLEIGPGPGRSTDLLRMQTRRLTAVESDARAARSLERRLAGTNVTVVRADAVAMPFRPGQRP
jgi:SAM-dependent methyltransferase